MATTGVIAIAAAIGGLLLALCAVMVFVALIKKAISLIKAAITFLFLTLLLAACVAGGAWAWLTYAGG